MGALLFVLFVVVPILELAVIIQVGQVAGVVPTIAALIGVSLVGAALVKREGLRAWRRVQETLQAGRMPAREVVDGALVLAGGALMLTPGFLTDAVGLVLVVPVTRALVNRVVRTRVRTTFLPGWAAPGRGGRGGRTDSRAGSSSRAGGGRSTGAHGQRPGGRDHEVVDVDVVGVERTDHQRSRPDPPDEGGDDRDDGGPARNGPSSPTA